MGSGGLADLSGELRAFLGGDLHDWVGAGRVVATGASRRGQALPRRSLGAPSVSLAEASESVSNRGEPRASDLRDGVGGDESGPGKAIDGDEGGLGVGKEDGGGNLHNVFFPGGVRPRL